MLRDKNTVFNIRTRDSIVDFNYTSIISKQSSTRIKKTIMQGTISLYINGKTTGNKQAYWTMTQVDWTIKYV